MLGDKKQEKVGGKIWNILIFLLIIILTMQKYNLYSILPHIVVLHTGKEFIHIGSLPHAEQLLSS